MRVKLKIWKKGEKVVDMDEKNLKIGGVGSLFKSLFNKLLKEKDKLTGIIVEYVPDKDELIQKDKIEKVREK